MVTRLSYIVAGIGRTSAPALSAPALSYPALSTAPIPALGRNTLGPCIRPGVRMPIFSVWIDRQHASLKANGHFGRTFGVAIRAARWGDNGRITHVQRRKLNIRVQIWRTEHVFIKDNFSLRVSRRPVVIGRCVCRCGPHATVNQMLRTGIYSR